MRMSEIYLVTEIKAPIELVFDLSRSINLHEKSTQQTHEKAISGKTTGLIDLHESVTWRAKHFGLYQSLTSKITAMEKPSYFVDEMVKGAFNHFRHEHIFTYQNGKTTMVDIFNFSSPFGVMGRVFDALILKKYLTKFLMNRNEIIKEMAESKQWEAFIGGSMNV
ncbi:MAG: ligand-binding SRPBCC domain-containing protein [Luteibaculaceae bacterium]